MTKAGFKTVVLAALAAGAVGCGGGSDGGSAAEPASAAAPPPAAPPTAPTGGPVPPNAPRVETFYFSPTKVSETLRFTAIAAGYHHTCALEKGGDTYCWGSNERGQLGSSAAMSTCAGGSFACSGTPVRVEGAPQFAQLTASLLHSCGLDAAGAAYCWGMGLGGQLGDGLRQSSTAPVAVAGGLRFTTLMAGIASGSTCGLTALGDAWCWGVNVGGELGNGTKSQLAAAPAPLAASTKLKAISIGQQHACALDLAGDALCWGNNWFGQLGVGSAGGAGGFFESFSPVAVLGGLKFEQIVAAGMHSCGLQSTGAAYCWGISSLLGAGEAGTDGSLPQRVVTAGARWQHLSRGYGQTCALDGDGVLYCWGQRMGNGDIAALPTRIASDQPFKAFSPGGTHACAIGLDERAYCWGWGSWGQVGQPPSDT